MTLFFIGIVVGVVLCYIPVIVGFIRRGGGLSGGR
jgi:hypothetical protein